MNCVNIYNFSLLRPPLVAEKVDWSGVWSVRPQPIGEDEPEE